MKLKFTYLMLLVIVFATACTKSKTAADLNPTSPSGTYAGQFRLIHIHKDNTKDTLKANILLTMSLTTGFKVTGDTATVHAGSYGSYIIGLSGSNTITFVDKTYPTTGTPTKTHLNGQYNYYYDGTVLQMQAFGPLDTLALQYDLKRSN
ncbi:hypothetical protein [Mucilaginibacter sp.]|uniref:hypothetical protein n=1 Tax=Mucilaginibacter sp. TaxID=1882438 RepID=UPI003D119D58